MVRLTHIRSNSPSFYQLWRLRTQYMAHFTIINRSSVCIIVIFDPSIVGIEPLTKIRAPTSNIDFGSGGLNSVACMDVYARIRGAQRVWSTLISRVPYLDC